MGQYHLTVNLDKREFLDPHKLGMGLKLLEQIGFEADMGDVLMLLLAIANGRGGGDAEEAVQSTALTPVIGRWGGDRVAVVGDYTEEDDLPHEFSAHDIYSACRLWQEADAKGQVPTEDEYVKPWADNPNYADMVIQRRHQYRRIVAAPRWTDISDEVIPTLVTNSDVEIITTDTGWRDRKLKPGAYRRVYLSPKQGEALAAYARRATTQAKVNFEPGVLSALSGGTVEEELAHYDRARRTNAAKEAARQGLV